MLYFLWNSCVGFFFLTEYIFVKFQCLEILELRNFISNKKKQDTNFVDPVFQTINK